MIAFLKREKNKIYFLLEMEPLTLIFCFNEFFISRKISKKNSKSRKISINKRYFRFLSLILTKLFSIKVKKVTKPRRPRERNPLTGEVGEEDLVTDVDKMSLTQENLSRVDARQLAAKAV